ncbi:ATP-dependent Clp protease proteolytic subunit [Streptomyces agglomeratus]|uniref:ATP-dependent Clp protease proteolytic subunit n=1 Tax=Streptomyces agglomeratus TaxID=285458 RepID=A0A1E5PF03_9ACTN|nr:ATP-dependent Clp protease proteolytic subunit [Streptomyces agglomeratus]OEJ28075.1 ATP-dependent Clp protease proteolytic subunit [Streptomyces agglomeratus]OEJ37862.1 ATP-dependent Clp protease proteolytic subunit [Streptomyces agglomeratus]OEJ47753.1 ATP-dependent Clp protease proteolytic subunit [Streptomyces agglomeratus]OEJ50397.1 ATP-dependent Clp protease proteolytic subunit [Streptomyces agglomeratus]OEJ57726.1 ATP-dependent Clp protease proteolytic subunit [Streptomyces agglomera
MNRPLSHRARYVLPEFTERTATGSRTVDPYGKLLDERIVFLGTAVDDTAANDVTAQFMHLEHAAPDRAISLYINSPGGSHTAMSAIYDTIQFVNCDVETICLGQAASSAALLLAAGTPGKRLALPGARVLLRQPSIDRPVHGRPSDLEIEARELARTRQLLSRLLARHTGQSADRVDADIERDKVFTAEAALAYGLVDHVVPSRKGSLASSPTR